jgi:hypothetical protein
MTIEALKQCHAENKAMIPFTKKVRGPNNDCIGRYCIKLSDVSKLFENTLWENIGRASGHKKWQHSISNVVIEYGNHEKDVDAGAVINIFNRVQSHLNFFKRDIFLKPAKYEADYVASAKRLQATSKPISIPIREWDKVKLKA